MVANSGKGVPLSVWSRVGTKLYAHESSSLLEEDVPRSSTIDVCVGTVTPRASTRSFLFDVAAGTSSSSSSSLKRSTFREISFVISPPDANVRVHPKQSHVATKIHAFIKRRTVSGFDENQHPAFFSVPIASFSWKTMTRTTQIKMTRRPLRHYEKTTRATTNTALTATANLFT